MVRMAIPERTPKGRTVKSRVEIEMGEKLEDMSAPKASVGKRTHQLRILKRDIER